MRRVTDEKHGDQAPVRIGAVADVGQLRERGRGQLR